MIDFEELVSKKSAVAVVGLGYVGLPLAVVLSRHFRVIGFDISPRRVEELRSGADSTAEVEAAALAGAEVHYTTDPGELRSCGVIIVAVPTPIDANRNPDLRPVIGATVTVGQNLAPGCVVAYESTVYPGLTEDVCVPLLEKHSGLVCGRDFSVGYSPERINPGDKVHTLENIVKVVSGQDEKTRALLARVYGTIIKAGIHEASSIKVAEAAKVIENTQRDLNIALMNELSLIFERMGIDTLEVLEAAGTKWNFLPFRPGLVGGHCIGVDPYYLTFKAQSMGYNPQVILAGRNINDSMARHVAHTAVKRLILAGCRVRGARIGVLGLTFKENVPDLRNTKVVDIVRELADYQVQVLVHDPLASAEEAHLEYGLTLDPLESFRDLDALILAVPHQSYLTTLDPMVLRSWFRDEGQGIVLDVRGALDRKALRDAGLWHWRL
ncbi:nucleotide sugar dehydrogenase [Desulfolutivibrio sulfoxidireducens]|uniref:nucleotide sugar dehydrogenase n=1 Tax=Desulfolutivibrio sulfoxidireducens TaxID=2773299 RepID=UPI00159D7179|nr:nucleotide sugar dehydrogenase [Desulfolutivibrio sulfoxidireducens]QLA20848.1 nucleotide sugar dehydrogenase [Desulfolutivibrio sulfoxidireducens]